MSRYPDDLDQDDEDFDDEDAVDPDDLIDAAELTDTDLDPKQRLRVALARVRNILLACADALDLAIEVVEEMESP